MARKVIGKCPIKTFCYLTCSKILQFIEKYIFILQPVMEHRTAGNGKVEIMENLTEYLSDIAFDGRVTVSDAGIGSQPQRSH